MDNHFTSRFINSLLLVWLCCSLMKLSSASTINCTSSERKALIAFKQNLFDPSARLSSWVGQNCCQWVGITCNFISGKVTKIDLRNSWGFAILQSHAYDPLPDPKVSLQYKKSCLGGDISSSLLELKHLSYLDLSLNYFEGAPIPYFFGMFKNLRYLNLSNAYFGGEIPLYLGNLSNLNYLDLSAYNQDYTYGEATFLAYDQLHVENLNWLSSLSSMEYLDMGGVNLSRARENWMHAVNKLSSLTELHLRRCDISSFDTSVGFQNLTSLRVFDLSENWINSSLPLWLSNLTSLIKLDLHYSYFQGTISHDFAKLKNLRYLDLSGNGLRSTEDHRPSFLRNFCKLQFFNLAGNHFGGKLDEFLGTSSNCLHKSLQSLNLRYNDLVGEIPNFLGTLTNLRYLDLSYNKLWGSLPNSIGNLSLLQHLDLSSNLLNGVIPPSFGQLSGLIKFVSYENSWKGVMTEAQLVNLTKLEFLAIGIDTNQEALVFNVSCDWIPPFKLKTLYLRNCLVGPQFPVWLQVQTKLIGDVTISNAGISDSVPNEWISNISSQITSLDLSNNLLKGKLSQLLASQDTNLVNRSHNLLEDLIPLRYPNLRYLYLHNNLLSGPIPANIGDLMPNLIELYFSKNHLNGKIPSSIQKISYLQVLSLSHNQLSGELFDHWGKLKSLYIIDLANNSLYGKIPSSIGLLTSLTKLMLSNNHFHGEIPKSLQNCLFMKSIDLSGNRLHGSLPLWIGVVVSQLELLNLRSNLFSGIIPRQWCNLPLLRVLDLSHNNLVGKVPSCLYNWITFIYDNNTEGVDYFTIDNINNDNSYVEGTTLVMKGRELEYDAILKYVLTIDLSRNKLSGEIPNEITNLVHLGTLNLSNNDLVGTIPENIGAMQQLETLDLSCNHLSGKIPTSLASLNFLAHLNLSFNNLTGRVPTGKQLETLGDPSIYEGNPSLCGSPLQSKCPGDKKKNNTSEDDGKENDSEMFSFFISMAIGFPVGLNIMFFTIFTNESRRMSYFYFVDRVSYNILKKVGFIAICFKEMRWRRR